MNNTHPKLVPQPYTNLLTERDVTRRPILETRHLGIDFGGLTAVSDFNIAIGATERCGQNYDLQPPDECLQADARERSARWRRHGREDHDRSQPHGDRPHVPEHPPVPQSDRSG